MRLGVLEVKPILDLEGNAHFFSHADGLKLVFNFLNIVATTEEFLGNSGLGLCPLLGLPRVRVFQEAVMVGNEHGLVVFCDISVLNVVSRNLRVREAMV